MSYRAMKGRLSRHFCSDEPHLAQCLENRLPRYSYYPVAFPKKISQALARVTAKDNFSLKELMERYGTPRKGGAIVEHSITLFGKKTVDPKAHTEPSMKSLRGLSEAREVA